MKRNVYKYTILTLAIAINIFIILQSSFNGSISTSQSGWVVNMIKNIINTFFKNAINENNIDGFTSFVRKLIGHFLLFGVSGLFTTWSIYLFLKTKINKTYLLMLISLLFGFFLATLTEFIQHFLPGRVGSYLDVIIDTSGYLLFLLLYYLIITIRSKNKEIRQ